MEKTALLKRILEESRYTVALCGSEMVEEGGGKALKQQERAYEIEKQYGESPEEIFTDGYYTTRPERFFEFYRNEILLKQPEVTESARVLARMEQQGKLGCMITANVYNLGKRAGIQNVINLHGNIFENRCPSCGREYTLDHILDSPKVPRCESCGTMIRPQVSLFGEMTNDRLVNRSIDEVSKADVLLVLGTTLQSEVFSNYIKFFDGRYLVVIHHKEHFTDQKADLVILDWPKNVLPQLGY